jgi:hypothetical protein
MDQPTDCQEGIVLGSTDEPAAAWNLGTGSGIKDIHGRVQSPGSADILSATAQSAVHGTSVGTIAPANRSRSLPILRQSRLTAARRLAVGVPRSSGFQEYLAVGIWCNPGFRFAG